MSNRAQFHTSDPSFNRPEKRCFQRRQSFDRREMLRFELDNPNRRSGMDRREENNVWNNLHRV